MSIEGLRYIFYGCKDVLGNRHSFNRRASFLLSFFISLCLLIWYNQHEDTAKLSSIKYRYTEYESQLKLGSSSQLFGRITSKAYKMEQENNRQQQWKNLLFWKPLTVEQLEYNTLPYWNAASDLDRCSLLVKALYDGDPKWNNSEILVWNKDMAMKKYSLLHPVERIRMYNHCFLDKGVDVIQVFKKLGLDEHNATEFNHRMFPMFQFVNVTSDQYLYPKLTDLRTGKVITKPKTKQRALEYNLNFLRNWRNEAKGKGLVITIESNNLHILRKLFKFLKENGNSLPIQLVFKRNVTLARFKDAIISYAEESDQHVTIIEIEALIDDSFNKGTFVGYDDKFLASIFNTFEDVVMMDIEVIPYVNPEELLENEEYKNSGLYMWRDKYLGALLHAYICTDVMKSLEPSMDEYKTIGSKFPLRMNDPRLTDTSDPMGAILHGYYNLYLMHQVDGGVILLNKKQKLGGLIMGMVMNMHRDYAHCSTGTKEAFWFGPYVAGMEFAVGTIDAGIIGPIRRSTIEDRLGVPEICSNQVIHVDHEDKLLWGKGTFYECESDKLQEIDIESEVGIRKRSLPSTDVNVVRRDEQQFASKEPKRGFLAITGFIIPSRVVKKWKYRIGSSVEYYCTFVDRIGDADSKLVRFDKKTKRFVNHLAQIWRETKISVG